MLKFYLDILLESLVLLLVGQPLYKDSREYGGLALIAHYMPSRLRACLPPKGRKRLYLYCAYI
jgi:hypothetical protein